MATFSSSAVQPPFNTIPPDHWATLWNLQSSLPRETISLPFSSSVHRDIPLREYQPWINAALSGYPFIHLGEEEQTWDKLFCSEKSDGPDGIRNRDPRSQILSLTTRPPTPHFCKSFSQLFHIRNTINIWLELTYLCINNTAKTR